VATAETATDNVKLRLSKILDKIAVAHIRQKAFHDMTLANLFFQDYARLYGDNEAVKFADEIRSFTSVLMISTAISYQTTAWPIRPLNIEAAELLMENEIKYFEIKYLMLFSDKPLPEAIAKLLKDNKD
jgi:hypothetical protein